MAQPETNLRDLFGYTQIMRIPGGKRTAIISQHDNGDYRVCTDDPGYRIMGAFPLSGMDRAQAVASHYLKTGNF